MKTCSLDYCDGRLYARGYCSAHYSQSRRGVELKPVKISTGPVTNSPCTFDGCVNNQQAKGLCGAHWRQQDKGQELRPLRQQMSFVERAMLNIAKQENGCWLWTGRRTGNKGPIHISRRVAAMKFLEQNPIKTRPCQSSNEDIQK